MYISVTPVIATALRKPANREDYKDFVNQYLEAERPYLVQGFSLQDLSLQTGINVPTLSALINKEYGMNFNDYINRFRVRYFKELVQDSRFHQWTLEAIANKAGFNSRTTFIRAFTKFAECSPSEYLKYVKVNQLLN